MAWWDPILQLLMEALGATRKRPPFNSDAQTKIDHAKADLKESKFDRRESKIDRIAEEIKGAREYGISRREWRKVNREARAMGIPFEEHWEGHPIRDKILKKIRKRE